MPVNHFDILSIPNIIVVNNISHHNSMMMVAVLLSMLVVIESVRKLVSQRKTFLEQKSSLRTMTCCGWSDVLPRLMRFDVLLAV